MKEIKWQEDFNILVKDMDEPRQFLAEKLSEFLKKVSKKPSASQIEDLNALIDGFRMHFVKEEKILNKYKYPEVDLHRKEHKKYLRCLVKLRRKMSEDPSTAEEEHIDLIGDTYFKHLDQSDKEYAPFIRLKRKIEQHSVRR